jgi:hypothetical protein
MSLIKTYYKLIQNAEHNPHQYGVEKVGEVYPEIQETQSEGCYFRILVYHRHHRL